MLLAESSCGPYSKLLRCLSLMSRRRFMKTTQHASNNLRRVTSKETTPSTLRRSSSAHINNKSIRRLKSRKSVHKTIWLTSSRNHYRMQRFRSLFKELVCVNFLSCNIASSLWNYVKLKGNILKYTYLILMYSFSLRLRAFFPLGFCYLTRF